MCSEKTLSRLTDHPLGRNNPHLKSIFKKLIVEGKGLRTKRGYAGLITSYLRFCKQQGINFIDAYNPKSLNPWAVMYWFTQRTWELGSCNSISSWAGALAFYCRHNNMTTKPALPHTTHEDFSQFKEDLIGSFSRKSAEKSPCSVFYITRYMSEQLGIVPGALSKIPYKGAMVSSHPSLSSADKLLKGLQMALIFVGIFRPGEVSYELKQEELDGFVHDYLMGLKWKHVKCFLTEDPRCRGGRYMQFEIPNFKNQKDKWTSMLKRIASPLCGKSAKDCVCPYFDVEGLFAQVLRWRLNIRNDKRPFKPTPIGKKRLAALEVRDENYVFVDSKGTKWKYEHFRVTCVHLTSVLGLPKEDKITPHCFRVGATSLAYAQNIPSLILCFYVEWSVRALGVSHAIYVKMLNKWMLANVAYDLLHGFESEGKRHNTIMLQPDRWVLRKEFILRDVYNEGPNDCAVRIKKRLRPELGDLHNPEEDFRMFDF